MYTISITKESSRSLRIINKVNLQTIINVNKMIEPSIRVFVNNLFHFINSVIKETLKKWQINTEYTITVLKNKTFSANIFQVYLDLRKLCTQNYLNSAVTHPAFWFHSFYDCLSYHVFIFFWLVSTYTMHFPEKINIMKNKNTITIILCE